ncbi:type II toxin-antitoxin system RelE/ParE family toxin [Brevundimonas sp.]|uniref:type II toxin-antitoxin system RelE/ParE family toxin n=1 Tax=Brevundimonas sp. TaxID=1871086 RepID=UPI0035AD8A5E
MKVVVRPAARRDFHNQVAWLSEQSPKAGRAASLRLVEAIDLLQDYPLIGHAPQAASGKSMSASANMDS